MRILGKALAEPRPGFPAESGVEFGGEGLEQALHALLPDGARDGIEGGGFRDGPEGRSSRSAEMQRSIASRSSTRAKGFPTWPPIPAARNSATCCGNTLAVNAMIGIPALAPSRARIARVALTPSITGICTSISTTS